MAIKDNIKKFRELNGWSIPELAKRMDIDKAGIYKWEDGTTVPGGKKLTAIADALGVTVNDLLDEKHTLMPKRSDNKENQPAEWEAAAFRKLIEGDAEYILVHRTAFENHRFTSLEQIEANAKELAEARAEIQRLVREFINYVKDSRGLGGSAELPKVQEAKKDTAV